jgi:hypothetical protein
MKRIINICLLLTFLLGYLEWGKNQSLFIFQAEAELFLKAKKDILSILHPVILLPFFGQLILFYTIFQKKINRNLSLLGFTCLSILMLLLLVAGLLTLNLKIIGSTIPFVITGFFALRYNWKRTPKE